jgi:hypothetical protein
MARHRQSQSCTAYICVYRKSISFPTTSYDKGEGIYVFALRKDVRPFFSSQLREIFTANAQG